MMTDISSKSIAAQMHYPLGVAESLFAQACVLARTMGLHQAHFASGSVSSEETQERFKVFRSLYLRDRSSLISRGSICWLPSVDCSLFSDLEGSGPEDSTSAARIQLAWLEDESYRFSLAADSLGRTPAESKSAMLRIKHTFEHWANTHDIFSPSDLDTHDIDLKLGFLAARIFVLRKSLEPRHLRRALDDSRASCLILVIACGKHELSMVDQLNVLLHPSSPSGSLGRSRLSKSDAASLSNITKQKTKILTPSRFYRLFNTFPVSAFFLLAKSVVWPSSIHEESKAEQDLDLLQRLYACFKEFDEINRVDNHTRKVGGVFQSLIEVVKLIKCSQQHQPRNLGMQQGINTHNALNTTTGSDGLKQLSGFSNLPGSSAPSVPPTSWDSFPINNALTMTSDSQSNSVSFGVVTPSDTDYQRYDPIPQPLLFPHMQQQILQPPSLDQQYTFVSDVSTDEYADIGLPSEPLASSSSTSFDITR